jgi:hypothetical protein
MGKRYEVPESLTIQKAFEYAGYQLIRGCGCRGGICGACGTVYRFPDSHKIEVGLACQTVVQPNMYLTSNEALPGRDAMCSVQHLYQVLSNGYRGHGLHGGGHAGGFDEGR